VEVPRHVQPDVYRGVVTLSARLARPTAQLAAEHVAVKEAVAVELIVLESLAVDSGDNDLWRHSRLRWLDSTIGSDPLDTGSSGDIHMLPGHASHSLACPGRAADCVRLERVGSEDEVAVLTAPGERELTLASHGLPAQLRVGGVALLAAPARLRLQHGSRDLALTPIRPMTVSRAGGGVVWRASSWARVGGPAAIGESVAGGRSMSLRLGFLDRTMVSMPAGVLVKEVPRT
tara:strand:- start:34 stop:729 length:696 start_codon:yes stop_codon:yes gene_type:complete